jgi:hypothetical protein
MVIDDSSALEIAVENLQNFMKSNKDALAISHYTRQLQTNSALPMEGVASLVGRLLGALSSRHPSQLSSCLSHVL